MIQLLHIFWDPKPEIFTLPILHYPVLWYGVLFASGFILGFPIFVGILDRYFQQKPEMSRSFGTISLHAEAVAIADRLTVYMVAATVLGARIGHLAFYETPSYYLHNPMQIFVLRGLSSHGAAIAIILTLGFFSYRFRNKMHGLSWLGVLDFISVPTALAGAFIRLGNFFNQEVLGVKSTVPWAIIFGHPADNSLPLPRHPVQLYESFAYALIFLILWRMTFSPKYLNQRGRIGGLFLILVFGFRIVIECWKLEQSALIPFASQITMGQILSIPLVLLGIWMYVREKIN